MKKISLLKRGLLNSLGVVIYIGLLVPIMNNGSKWFGEKDNPWLTPMLVLLLFIFSALVTASLVIVKPVMLYLDGAKKEALRLLFYTGASLFAWLVILMIVLLLIK